MLTTFLHLAPRLRMRSAPFCSLYVPRGTDRDNCAFTIYSTINDTHLPVTIVSLQVMLHKTNDGWTRCVKWFGIVYCSRGSSLLPRHIYRLTVLLCDTFSSSSSSWFRRGGCSSQDTMYSSWLRSFNSTVISYQGMIWGPRNSHQTENL
jgi:hypothetical protein